MSAIVALGLTTAILCTIWTWGSGVLGLLGWAGFAGCTAYFACPKKGLDGVKLSMCCTISGVFWAMLSIFLTKVIPFSGAGLVFCFLATYFMCVQNRFRFLTFIPGTFIGSFSTFASNGNWKLMIPSLLLGVILGFACDQSGVWLHAKIGKKEEVSAIAIEK